MNQTGSVSTWIAALRAGEDAALARLHTRYWPQVVALARRRLGRAVSGLADEEDVAQEAFWDACRSLRGGRMPQVADRQSLLALLTHIVACKAANLVRHEHGTAKRGRGAAASESALAQLADSACLPSEQALLADCYLHFVRGLPERLRECAELYLAGYTQREIAAAAGCVDRTVQRKLQLILAHWRTMVEASLEEPL